MEMEEGKDDLDMEEEKELKMEDFEMEVEKNKKMKDLEMEEGGEELEIGGYEDLSPADRNMGRKKIGF